MSDTESFDSVMAEMRKVVMDCDMERCDMYDGDCYQCQGDILDRIQRAHERELAQARDPQRLRGTKPNTFDGSIEALREFRWQHATNDDDAVPYINAVKEMHDHELEHVRKAEYARGFHDGERSMDAEHYAVALRLRGLRFDGGSHDNLSRIAYAIYPCATGWTCESSEGLRDRLIDLLGGVHEPDVALPTYDVLGNERHKAVCRLREIQTDAGGFVKALAEAVGVEWQAPRVVQIIAEVRDRLIYLLGGDTEPNSQKSPILANSDGENGGEVTITDELRKKIHEKVNQELYVVVEADDLYAIADRIDEQLKTIRQNDYDEWQETVLQSAIEQMTDENLTVKDERDHLRRQMDQQRAMLTEQSDEARAKVLRLESENAEWRRGAELDADKLESLTGAYNDAVAERDELRKKLENVLENARDALNEAAGRWAKADEERRELQRRLDAIREAVNAV